MFKTIFKVAVNNLLKKNIRFVNSSTILAAKSNPEKTDPKLCPPPTKSPEVPPCKVSDCPDNKKKEEEKIQKAVKEDKVNLLKTALKKPVKEGEVQEDDEEISTEPLLTANYDDSKVVIIGAGVAGLAAARYLEENNIKNYVILEALGRLGGRIQTEWFGDTVAELGAKCAKGSSVFHTFLQCAMADGVLKGPITHTSIFATCDGRNINESTGLIAYDIFKRIYCESLDVETERLDYINFRIEQELINFPSHLKQDAARVILGLFALLYKRGDNLKFVTSHGNGTYLQIPGGTVKVPLGYYGLIQPMIDKIPSEKIKLNKPVQNIRWGAVVCKDTPRALVKCCDGSVYPADYVIITVSLGVLKTNNDTLFCPALPADKVEATRLLGYHHLNHAYFRFAEPIWSWATETIDLKFKDKDLKDREDWTKGIVRIKQVPGSNNVLWVKIAGDEAKAFEKLDQSTIVNSLLNIIKNEMQLLCIPTVVSSIQSSWSNNVYFNGAYSCLPIGVSEDVQHKLASPLPGNNAPVTPILFFAGEATCPKLFATVQGAKISGIREASRIKRLIVSSVDRTIKNQEKVAMTG